MLIPRLPPVSLALMFVLAACGGKDPATSAEAGSTGASGGTDTGASVSTTGVSMSSDPSASSDPTTGGGTNPTTSTTGATTAVTTTTGDATTTGATTDPSGGSSTGAAECQIEQPLPGRCNGGKPHRPAPTFGGALAPAAAKPGPGVLVDDGDEAFASTGCNFICETDTGDTITCDIFAQDCGPGEKCNAWAEGGGSSWDATKCVPVDADPDGIGEPCTVEGGGVSGIDSCVKGAMCFGTGDDNMGTCIEQCSCSLENPVCTTQNTTCSITNDGVLALCLPICDPLDIGACGGGDVCISSGEFFICVIDASGDAGGVGDNCQFANACDPGHFCGSNNGMFPGCDDVGCCTPFCELTAPQCPQGTACMAWYEEGMAPKCFDDVGACI